MSDPVAEAAAQLAVGTQEGGAATAGELGTNTSATDIAASAESGTSDLNTAAVQADAIQSTVSPEVRAAVLSTLDTLVAGKEPVPNVVPAAVESTTGPASAPSAAGADITSNIAASSVEPLHVRVAAHLEAIFQMTKEHVEAAPNEATAHAQTVKTHIGDVLHRISNGMAVAEGELVQKLEALYRAL